MGLLSDPRADKVEQALGAGAGTAANVESFGTFGLVSPWVLARDFDPSVTAQVAAQGGASLLLHVGGGPLGATLGNLTGGFTLALMWDDEQIAFQGTVQEGTNVVVEIGPPPAGAQRLSVWVDTVVTVDPGPIGVPGAAQAVADKLAASGQPTSPPSIVDAVTDAVKGGLGKALDFQQTTIQTVVIVGALAVLAYFLFAPVVAKVASGGAV